MENSPSLISCQPLSTENEKIKKISIPCDKFSLGRSVSNTVVIPLWTISKHHCEFMKTDNEWIIQDRSDLGVEVNGNRLGNGKSTKLTHNDVITLEPSLVYKFFHPNNDSETPTKRLKLESPDERDSRNIELINNLKLKVGECQDNKINLIKNKMQSAKQIQLAAMLLMEELLLEMNIQKVKAEFSRKIENLQEDKEEVQRQKSLLLEERDAQLVAMRLKKEEIIHSVLKETGETESGLMKPKEDLLTELSRDTDFDCRCNQNLMTKLQATIKEQEDIQKDPGEGTSRQADRILEEAIGQIMDNELQCGICNELFIEATTLNCTHTFCKHCITMWKKKKRNCPICRTRVKSECRSLALDSLIKKMVEKFSDETKKKRQEILRAREEEEKLRAQTSLRSHHPTSLRSAARVPAHRAQPQGPPRSPPRVQPRVRLRAQRRRPTRRGDMDTRSTSTYTRPTVTAFSVQPLSGPVALPAAGSSGQRENSMQVTAPDSDASDDSDLCIII